MKIGVISDTHGMIHPDVFGYLDGVDLILHAGDVGGEDVLTELETIAPVRAVSGNTDTFPITWKCGEKDVIEVKGKRIYLTHRLIENGRWLTEAMEDLIGEEPHLVVYGHTHQQHSEVIDGILFFNPGSGGQRRAGTRMGVGVLTLENGEIDHEIIYLE